MGNFIKDLTIHLPLKSVNSFIVVNEVKQNPIVSLGKLHLLNANEMDLIRRENKQGDTKVFRSLCILKSNWFGNLIGWFFKRSKDYQLYLNIRN